MTSFLRSVEQLNPVRVLIDCPGAWSVFSSDDTAGIGGAEVRATTFARSLAQSARLQVTLAVQADGLHQACERDGVQIEFLSSSHASSVTGRRTRIDVRHAARRLSGSLMKRVLHTPPRSLVHERLTYDVLLIFGVTNRTASLVRSAKRMGRRVMVFLTSDRTLEDIQLQGSKSRGVYGEIGYFCRYALQHADVVVAQKAEQRELLWRRLGIQAALVRNPIDLSEQPMLNTMAMDSEIAARLPDGPFVLWVGRADTFSKRADLALAIARQCSRLPFVMVMNRHDDSTYRRLTDDLPPNVQVIQRVPYQASDLLYRAARLLLNTSVAEGFPNSFLQAGKYGVPVVSLQVDPEGMLRHGCGMVAGGDLTTAAESLEKLWSDPTCYGGCSRAIHAYVADHHELSACSQRLADLIIEAATTKAMAA